MLIVDGYNWLFGVLSDSDLSKRPLERQRNEAVRLCSGWADWYAEPVLIVFDGAGERSRQQVGGVEVWFTPRRRTADDEIVSRVQAADRSRPLRVVTGDRELGQRVRAGGAEVWSPREFSGRLKEMRNGQTIKLTREDLAAFEKPGAEADVDAMVREFEQAPPPDER